MPRSRWRTRDPGPPPVPAPRPAPLRTSVAAGSFASRLLAWWDVHGRKNLPWQQERTPYRVWVRRDHAAADPGGHGRPVLRALRGAVPGRGESGPRRSRRGAAPVERPRVLRPGAQSASRGRRRHAGPRRGLSRGRNGNRGAAGSRPVHRGRRSSSRATAGGPTILDANVKRVLARRHRVAGAVSSAETLDELWRLAESHTPVERVADYTQAIMDLGATVCRRSGRVAPIAPFARTARRMRQATPSATRGTRRAGSAASSAAGSSWWSLRTARVSWSSDRRTASGAACGRRRNRDAGESVNTFLTKAGIAADLVDQIQQAGVFPARVHPLRPWTSSRSTCG